MSTFTQYLTKVKHALTLMPQPDAYTCQSACIAMATRRPDTVQQVRQELLQYGVAGDPYNMGRVLKRECPGKYEFHANASLNEMREWIKQGCFLIIHSWLTNSGHVIAIKGMEVDPVRMSYRLRVLDPFAEFQAKSWSYNRANGFDGYYSSYLIYATAVVGQSHWDSHRIYRRGELDSSRKGAWVHVIFP